MSTRCTHLDSVKTDHHNTKGCEECLKTGDTWVHLRLCRTCGHVGCCDDSKNRHATKHFHTTQHPIVTSIEPLGEWYPAEDYHQEYWQGDGQRNPYCLAVIPPKLRKLRKSFANRLKEGAGA